MKFEWNSLMNVFFAVTYLILFVSLNLNSTVIIWNLRFIDSVLRNVGTYQITPVIEYQNRFIFHLLYILICWFGSKEVSAQRAPSHVKTDDIKCIWDRYKNVNNIANVNTWNIANKWKFELTLIKMLIFLYLWYIKLLSHPNPNG